jgi:hypothetical protein
MATFDFVPSIGLKRPIKAEQAGVGQSEPVPKVDSEGPIGYEVKKTDVPTVNTESDLKIEGITKNEDVPKSDLRAELEIDNEKETDTEHGKFGRNGVVMAVGISFAVMVVVAVIFVYRLI